MNKRVLNGMETKKRLIDCAQELFREKGYYGMTVDEIIKKANSSKGSFYTHFSSKYELLLNLIPLIDENYLEFFNTKLEHLRAIEKITLFIHYVFKTIEDKIGLELISTVYSSQIKDFTANRFLISSDRTYYQVFEEYIEEGKKKNEIIQGLSTEHIISILTTCIRGVIYDWCLKKGSFNLSIYGEEITNMVLNQIKL